MIAAKAGGILRVVALAAALAAAPAGHAAAQGTAAPGGASDATLSLAQDEAIDRLLAVIADDAARAALVARLEAARGGAGADAGPVDAPAAEAGEEGANGPDLARGLAAATAAAAGDLAREAGRAWAEVARLGTLGERLGAAPDARRAGAALLATILSTIAASLAFEGIAGRAARRLRPPAGAGAVRQAAAAALALILRLGAIALAWAVGYALATLAYSEGDRPSEAQTLYLNAFAAYGLARLALRALSNPDAWRGEPALAPGDAGAQRVVYRRLAVVAGVVMQGFMFVVPVVGLWAGFQAVRPVRTLVATLAAILALLAIRAVARALDRAPPPMDAAVPPDDPLPEAADPAPDPPEGFIGPLPEAAGLALAPGLAPAAAVPAEEAGPPAERRGASGLWRRFWPPLAVLYVGYAWLVAVTRPALVEEIVLGGTVMTAAALALLLVALHLLRKAPAARAPLPPRLAARLPRLGPRADRITGLGARVLAAFLAVLAALLVVVGWEWVDLSDLAARPALRAAIWRLASALLVAGGAALAWAVVASWIDARLEGETGVAAGRSRTLLALFRNAFTVAVVVLAGMVALSQLGLDIAPLLAGAGVVGLAIGFGAQTLVKDIITGIFIQLENAINEGDVVGVAGITGGVEKVTIRSVRLRTMDGATHVIPFSSVTTVTNLTRDFGYHVAELQVAYGDDVGAVRAALHHAFDLLRAEPDHAADILEPLEPPVVVALRDAAALVRTRIKTRPGRQWDVGNRYSEILKATLDERGIEVPVPSRTILLPPGGPA